MVMKRSLTARDILYRLGAREKQTGKEKESGSGKMTTEHHHLPRPLGLALQAGSTYSCLVS